VNAYWQSVVEEAFGEAHVVATEDQIATVISWVESAHDNHGMEHGYDVMPNRLQVENETLTRQAKEQSDKADNERYEMRRKHEEAVSRLFRKIDDLELRIRELGG